MTRQTKENIYRQLVKWGWPILVFGFSAGASYKASQMQINRNSQNIAEVKEEVKTMDAKLDKIITGVAVLEERTRPR